MIMIMVLILLLYKNDDNSKQMTRMLSPPRSSKANKTRKHRSTPTFHHNIFPHKIYSKGWVANILSFDR